MSARVTAALALVLSLGVGCDDQRARSERDETRAVMREIFNGLQVALPASVDPSGFGKDRPEVAASLEILARNAARLQKHVRTQDRQMRFLARLVVRDARNTQRHYEEGRLDRSAFVLRQIAENCVVCHTRLPDPEDSPVAAGFVDQGVLASLPPEPRATLLMATRRFDEALAVLGTLLADPLTHPAVVLGPLTDYLVVSIRVKQDFVGPAATLEAFAERDDLWPSLRDDVQAWRHWLPDLAARANGKAGVAEARALVEEGDTADAERDGQRGRLHYVVASGILERFIDRHEKPDADLAEAFYWLGILEARIGRNYWVTPAPFLLEEAIRLAPARPFAADALARLESELFAVYEGSDLEQLPAEDRAQLAELRALIEAATSG
jgi:hypothetical protein